MACRSRTIHTIPYKDQNNQFINEQVNELRGDRQQVGRGASTTINGNNPWLLSSMSEKSWTTKLPVILVYSQGTCVG